MFVARDEDGVLGLYRTKPKRTFFKWFDRYIFRKKNCWRGHLLAYLKKDRFMTLTWEDEPIKVYVGIYQRNDMERIFKACGIIDDNEVQEWLNNNFDVDE